MDADVIPMEEFETYLTDLCGKGAMNAERTMDEVLSARALELKGKLAQRSPRDTGEYSRGWRVRTATVNHEKEQMGADAAHMLVKLLNRESVDSITYEPELVKRHSAIHHESK